MFKFLHAADIHLDSPRAGLDRDEDAPAREIQQAPRRALANLVKLALDEEVDFVLIAGDLYDGDWKDFRTGLFFVEQMVRLKEADIPVFLIAGNHDAANRMTRTLSLPENVTQFGCDEPETHRLETLGVAVHGQSFAEVAVTDDLSKHYPQPVEGMFNIGLLHTSATKSGEHETYAPCTVDGLKSKRYQYWALGHIHKREILHEHPHIVFPGNLQGRHIRETGPKGCVIVTVNEREEVQVDFHAVDVFRWEHCQVDVTGAETPEDAIATVASQLKRVVKQSEGRPLAVRIELAGACRAHEALAAEPHRWQMELKGKILELGAPIWLEKLVRRTSLPVEVDEAILQEGPVGELVQFIHELQANDEELTELAGELAPLCDALPPELGGDWQSPEAMRQLLDDVQQMLTHQLLTQGGDA